MIINMNGAKAPETPSPTLQEKTVTPETLPTVIGADEGYDGLSQVTVNPDAQLKPENIRSGKTVFGVTGAFVGEPQPVADAEAQFFYDVISYARIATPPAEPIKATKLRGTQQFMGATIGSGILDLSNVTITDGYRLFGWSTLNCDLVLPTMSSVSQIFKETIMKSAPTGGIDYSGANDAFSSAVIKDGVLEFTESMLSNGKLPSYFLVNLGFGATGGYSGTITIPANVTSMDAYNCMAFTIPRDGEMITLVMKPTTPPTLGVASFKSSSPDSFNGGFRIIVPVGTLSAYQSASNWSSFASIMEEATE